MEIVFDTGKGLLKFKVNGTVVVIEDIVTGGLTHITPQTFEEKIQSNNAASRLRRKKGEKYFAEWKKDLEKYKSFTTEEEIVEDIMNDFHKKRGLAIISKK